MANVWLEALYSSSPVGIEVLWNVHYSWTTESLISLCHYTSHSPERQNHIMAKEIELFNNCPFHI